MSSREGEFRLRRFPPVQLALYVLLRVVIMVVHMFPMSQASEVGRFLGRIIRFIDRKHGRIAAKNLERSRGVCAPDEIPAFIDRVYHHIAFSFVEMLMLPKLMKLHRLDRMIRIEGRPIVDRLLQEGKGLIFAIAHLGNWELSGIAVALAGYPLRSLARPIENPWIDRYLNRFRTSTGSMVISKYGAWATMVDVIERNEMLVIQIDQDARHSGVYVNFFERPASVHRSPALLAMKYGTPIVPVNVFRDPVDGLHRVVFDEPIRPEEFRGRPEAVKALTQHFTLRFEGYIRQHPEQWFWLHDRWKTAERVARKRTEALV